MAERTPNPIDLETKDLRKLYNRKITLLGKIKKAKAQLEPAEEELRKVIAAIAEIEKPPPVNRGDTEA